MGGFTTYGLQQVFAAGMGAIDAPQLYVALYSGSANPTGPPVELALVGYARAQVAFTSPSTDHFTNAYDVVFGPMAAGSYTGVAIVDDPLAGAAWCWDDESGPITIVAGGLVTFAAGTLSPQRV